MKATFYFWLTLLTPLLFLNPAHAAIYKWVDEEGHVNYSSVPPPPGVKWSRVGVNTHNPAPPAPTAATGDNSAGPKGKAPVGEKTAGEIDKNNPELKKLCAQSRTELGKLQQEGRLRVTKEDGSTEVMSEKARADRIKAVQEKLKKYCQ